jgi:outer membrane protein assembly factor BamB
MAGQDAVFIGVQGTVLALDSATGEELWRTSLRGSDFVNVALQDGKVFASTKGEIFALDPGTGTTLWRNKLKGLGLGLVTIAGSAQVPAAAARQRRQQAGAAGAAAAAS